MIAIVLSLSLLGVQRQDSSAVARELEQIVHLLAETWKSGKCDAWGAFIAPEWSVTHIDGSVITRTQALEMCRTPAAPIVSLTSDEISVRSYSDAAVVTGRTVASTGGANSQTVRLRFTDVFVRRDGRWQAVASHATRLMP